MRRHFRRVVIESPFAGPTHEAHEENLRYLRACMHDCLERGESPYASHGLLTQPGVLDDWKPEDRERGILAGFEWRAVAQATVIYADRGISQGMRAGIRKAVELEGGGVFDHVVEYRLLGGEWSAIGGPDEIRKLIQDMHLEHDKEHQHLKLVPPSTGAGPSVGFTESVPTPAELSMAGVPRREITEFDTTVRGGALEDRPGRMHDGQVITEQEVKDALEVGHRERVEAEKRIPKR